MLKTFLLLFTFLTTLFAQSYNFTELRYSDAIGKYTQLEGTITFKKDGLNIKYPKSARELEYSDGTVLFYQDAKEIPLDDSQASHMMHYFDILRVLHEGDESELQDMFDVSKKGDTTLLFPTGTIKYYIEHIELTKEKNVLRYVKLFLKNSDYITINIYDEIH